MATKPHHDDDQAKNPDGSKQLAIPNMSLDDAHEEPLVVEEVFEADIPIAESAPKSDAAAFVLSDDDLIAEEVADAAPASEVIDVAPISDEDIFAAEVVEAVGSSAVLAAPSDVVAVAPVSGVHAEPVISAPASDVDLMKMFNDEPAVEAIAQESPAPPEAAIAPPIVEDDIFAAEVVDAAGSSVVLAAPSDVVAIAPDSGVHAVPVISAPASDVDLMKMFNDEPAVETSAQEPIAEGDIFAAEVVETTGSSAVLAASSNIAAAAPASGVHAESAISTSASDVDLMKMFKDEPAVEASEEEPVAVSPAPPEAVLAPPIAHRSFAEMLATASVPIAEPVSNVPHEEEISPASGIHIEAPVSVENADEAEASPLLSDEVAPASGVQAEEIVFDDEVAEAAPASEIVAAEEFVAEAEPSSGVFASEEIEVASAPASEIFEAEEIVDAAPASGIQADEVLVDEVVVESASGAISAEIAEEVAEVASSATRKAEAVLDDDAVAVEAASAELINDATEFVDPPSARQSAPASGTAEDAVLEADVAEATEAGSSSVLFEEAVSGSSAAKKPPGSDFNKTAAFDQTVAFGPPSSNVKKADSDILVTEEEIDGTPEASSVDLGEMPVRKGGSSVAGIDKIAEALESDVDLGAEGSVFDSQQAKTVPSVEFDELLDDDSAEMPAKGKQQVIEDEDAEAATEMDGDMIEAEIFTDKKSSKKDKKAKQPVAMDDDVDMDDLFADTEAVDAEEAEEVEAVEAFDADEVEAEPAEAFDADEAEAAEMFSADDDEVAEAAEAFDEAEDAVEEAEAFDDDDYKPAKKSKPAKMSRMHVDDDEDVEAVDDEEEFTSKKKKGKDKKSKAAPAPARPSTMLRVLVGMFLATLLIGGGGAAVWHFEPDRIKELADMSENVTKVPPPKEHVDTNLQKAHAALDQRKFDEARKLLENATEDAEFSVRGEAKWLAYYEAKKDAPLDKDAAEIKDAKEDLKKGKNELLIRQIETTLKERSLADQLTKITANKTDLEKQLAASKLEKDMAEKLVDSVADVLVKGKFIDDKDDFAVTLLEKILKGLSTDKAGLDSVNEVLKTAKIKGLGEEGLKEVLKLKKDTDDSFAAVNKVLETENIKDKGAKGVQEIVKARNEFMKDRDDLVTTIAAAFKELVDGKIVKESPNPRKEIVAGTKLARQKAESPLAIPLGQLGLSLGNLGTGTGKVVEQSFSMAKLVAQLEYYQVREPFVETPEKKLNTYITLLQDRGQNDPKRLADISREADWVRSPAANAEAESKAKARYVEGLALRNLEKFAEAKSAFTETLKMTAPITKVGPWSKLAEISHKELTDPFAYYIPRIERFQTEGNLKAALDEANTSLKAMPTAASLFAHRGLVRYESIRGKGAKVPADTQKQIRADAENASKDEKLAAEAAYIVGLLEEELGNWTEAEKLYRQAIKMYSGMSEEAGKYQVALARLLLRDREAAVAPPVIEEKKKKDDTEEKKKKDAKDDASIAPREQTIVLHPWSLLAVTAIVAQPIDELEDKDTLARLNETMKLAEELIASKNDKVRGQGYLLKGMALSKLGKRTEGLKEYTKGMLLIDPSTKVEEMAKLIEDHPAFQQPDVSNTPNPIMAERHFGEAMHFYWSKQFPQAEAQFRQAVKYYDKDARYQYYLGLSQLQQKTRLKRDAAYYSFEQGARLEAQNPDSVREINASLERIQGELRQLLNSHRYKAKSGEPEAKK